MFHSFAAQNAFNRRLLGQKRRVSDEILNASPLDARILGSQGGRVVSVCAFHRCDPDLTSNWCMWGR